MEMSLGELIERLATVRRASRPETRMTREYHAKLAEIRRKWFRESIISALSTPQPPPTSAASSAGPASSVARPTSPAPWR